VPVVTALRERPRGRVEIDLDGASWRLVPTDAVVRSGLFVGRALDRETARTLGRELRRAEALTRALRALAARDRSRRSLDDRLGAAGVAARSRQEALETLERAGLVDDERLALGRAQGLAERGYGDAAIRFDLERQGLGGESVAAALAGLEPERERARRLVEQRGRDARAARWLAAKGFEASAVEDAVGGFAEET
jgi:SOS response regulatory protein OraA/RecX